MAIIATDNQPKILIVDDNPDNLATLCAYLDGCGAGLFEATSGEEALALADEYEFALILLDVQMPGIDGFETATQLRAAKGTRQIPIMFVTAINQDQAHLRKGYAIGAVGYLFKPVDPVIVQSKVGIFLELYHQRREISDYADRLEDANQELSRFAYTVSHDLKAPLRAVKQLSEFIEEDLGDGLSFEIKENMQLLKNRVLRMEDMINDILAYTRAGTEGVEREWLDLDEMLAGLIDLLAPPSGFVVQAVSPMPHMEAARGPLQQVFFNLIANALKHHHRKIGRIEISHQETERYHIFSVKDDGPGIHTKHQDKIFGMLVKLRSRDEVEGSGIGLSLVKKLVDSAGGHICLCSSPGMGSVFTFYWPKTSQPQPSILAEHSL